MIITDKFTFSNDYCEIIGIYIPKQNYINITIYRPPGCPTDKFNEIIQMSDNWINRIERNMGNPIININGDFNFPNMCKWTDDSLNTFIDNYEDRKNKGLIISEVNTQTMILYEFLNSHFLTQLVNSTTRKNNTLDLIFSNDNLFITEQECVVNNVMSDHNLLIVKSNVNIDSIKDDSKAENIYDTNLLDYDLLGTNEDEWNKISDNLKNINWKDKLPNKNVSDKLGLIIESLENVVKEELKHKNNKDKVTHNKCGNKFKSKNFIPRDIRKLFRQKSKVSKALL